VAAIVLAVVIALCWLFLSYDKPEFAEKIIVAIISFAGGLAAGFGLSKRNGKHEN
jgi:hypothetical protein